MKIDFNMAIIKDYEPEVLTFVLPEAVKEQFPLELQFENAESEKDILKAVNEHFNALFPENEMATRYMDDVEKQDLRSKYCKLVEQKLPEAEISLLNAKEEAKRIKSDAEERLNALNKQVKDYAAKVQEGTEEKQLPATKTFRIALNGYFLYYAMLNGKVVLAKAEKIPSYDKSSLWAQEDKNRIAMMELFGLDFPAPDKPSDEEFDEEHDLLPDNVSEVMGEEEFNQAVGDE
jgi:hypothetical protein